MRGVLLDGERAFDDVGRVVDCARGDLVGRGIAGWRGDRAAEVDLAVGGAGEEVGATFGGEGEGVDGGGAVRCEDVEGLCWEGRWCGHIEVEEGGWNPPYGVRRIGICGAREVVSAASRSYEALMALRKRNWAKNTL